MAEDDFNKTDCGQMVKINKEALSDLEENGAPEEAKDTVKQRIRRLGCLQNLIEGPMSKERPKKNCTFVKGGK